jgi:hypothetical protein
MENMQQMINNFIGNKEQFEKSIFDFVNNRFIPKYASKSMNEKIKITNENNIRWVVKLENENIEIAFYFNRTIGGMRIHSEIDLPGEIYLVTDYLESINDVFDSIIKIMIEDRIKGIFFK